MSGSRFLWHAVFSANCSQEPKSCFNILMQITWKAMGRGKGEKQTAYLFLGLKDLRTSWLQLSTSLILLEAKGVAPHSSPWWLTHILSLGFLSFLLPPSAAIKHHMTPVSSCFPIFLKDKLTGTAHYEEYPATHYGETDNRHWEHSKTFDYN